MELASVLNRPPRILVAEDDWINRDLLETLLTASGCEVIPASDGQAALELIQGKPLDLALVDIQMPRMNGVDLCAALKALPNTRFVPVIIVTALNNEEERLRAIEAGADDFVAKPYHSLVLLTRVRSLLRIKKLSDEIEARNRVLRQMLDRYVSEEVTDVILTDPERYLKLGGETRLVTVLFADIRGFTRYTEQHSGPQVIRTLNCIFPPLSQVVFNHRGTFDKYLGDGLMAFYGAPVAGEDDAQRALESALAMQQTFGKLCQQREEDMKGLGLGVGLHTGEAVVGNIGSENMMDYTVVGDVVNVAKGLQEKAGGTEILLSTATYDQVKGIELGDPEAIHLPGRQEPIMAYRLDRGLIERAAKAAGKD